MPEFIANPPWYLPIVIAGMALVTLFQGNRAQNKNMKVAGVVLAVLAALIIVLGQSIESDEEKVTRRTHEFAAAIDTRDWKKFGDLLDPKVTFNIYAGRDQFVSGATRTADLVGVKNISLTNMETKFEANAYQVDFTASADFDKMPYRTPTNWRFFWSKSPGTGEFLLYEIRFIASPQASEDAVLRQLQKP